MNCTWPNTSSLPAGLGRALFEGRWEEGCNISWFPMAVILLLLVHHRSFMFTQVLSRRENGGRGWNAQNFPLSPSLSIYNHVRPRGCRSKLKYTEWNFHARAFEWKSSETWHHASYPHVSYHPKKENSKVNWALRLEVPRISWGLVKIQLKKWY